DFRRPTTQHFFPVSNMIGLSDVLTGGNSLKSALQRPGEMVNLLILTAGKLPPNPSELLGSEKMHALITELEEWADWVLIDTPPLLAVADGTAVARWCDGVLMVTKAGVSTRDEAKKATEMLTQVGARIIGSVVWGLEESGGGGYGYYGGKGYKGYYYYSDYYTQYQGEGSASGHAKTRRSAPAAATAQNIYIPAVSPGRRLAVTVGRVLTGVFAFVVVVVVVVLVVYFLDQAFGWGLLEVLGG
ncbi:MAG: CpsD/CapB family tyrosine-protein kinase, partial [Actinomycetia bacterium]|nr:CpsD/CapB family tyrosine-protein kinase [Actinomycetes bacterium]